MGNTIGGVGVVDDLPVPVFLPEEVLIQILLWLPVISLLRFKSVCKSWRDLIQTSFFIDLHTSTTFNSSSSKQLGGDTFILQASVSSLYKLGGGGRPRARERNMFMLSIGSGSGSGSRSSGSGDGDDDQVVFKLDNLGFPPYYKGFPHQIYMVGSCNGLICLYDHKLRDVSLWNPATRQFRILPKSITIQEEEEEEEEEGMGGYDFVALGFDVKTKDYKVVQISCFSPTYYIEEWRPGCIWRVQVYSLSTDSWRLLEEGINWLPAKPPFHATELGLGLYLNGSYFFVGTKCPTELLSLQQLNEQGEIRNNSLMFSFDFTKEIFTTTEFPDHDERYNLLLSYLGDKIALFTTRLKSSFGPERGPNDDYENYDIWVLNEQGGGDDNMNKKSWAKLHSFQIKHRLAREWILPRGILNNGEFALIETKTEYLDHVYHIFNELHLLNLVTKEQKKSFPIWDKVSRATVYKHSLVSIIGGGNGAAAAAANRVVGRAMCEY